MRWPRLVQTDANEYGGVVFQWLDEAHEKPETEPVFEDLTIHCHECAGYTELSHTLIRRSALDVESILRTLYSEAAEDTIDNVIIAGSGVGQPTGIINTAGIRLVNRHVAGAVDYTDLVHLKHAVRPFHRRRATFAEGDDVDEALELSVDTHGRPLYNASMANGPYDRLVGYPYNVTVRTPALGTAGDIIYGNPAMYILAVEQEVLIDSSDHFKFQENKRAYRLFFSIGGIAVLPRAFAILGEEES
jgi:HK97 family phage major capsid protein